MVAWDGDMNSGEDVSDDDFTVSDGTDPSVTVNAPDGGESWYVDSFFDITWSATDNVGVTSIDILLSSDGGATYPHTIATGEVNDGVYPWYVDVAPTTEARVKVVAWDGAGNSGEDVSDGDFEVYDPAAGAGSGGEIPTHLVISGIVPNPFSTHAVVRFGIPTEAGAELGIYDVSGRLVARLIRDRLTAGYHEVEWTGGGAVGPGLYFLKLRSGSAEVTRKIVVSR